MVFPLHGLSTCLKTTKLIFSLISFSISRVGYPLLSNKYINKPFLQKILLKMYNIYGFNEAFIVLSCQKAIKLFSLRSRKFLRKTFFRLGQNTESPISETWETGCYSGCGLMQPVESFLGCVALAVCHVISPLDSHPLFSFTLLNKNVNKYI